MSDRPLLTIRWRRVAWASLMALAVPALLYCGIVVVEWQYGCDRRQATDLIERIKFSSNEIGANVAVNTFVGNNYKLSPSSTPLELHFVCHSPSYPVYGRAIGLTVKDGKISGMRINGKTVL